MINLKDRGTNHYSSFQIADRSDIISLYRVGHESENVFNSMKAMSIRTIGYVRAVAKIGLTNLTYNLMRGVQLNKKVHNVCIWG
jgi:hypothetical protein